MKKQLLSLQDLADTLVCDQDVVRGLVEGMHPQTSLPCVEAGGELYFDPEEVCRWFEYTKESVEAGPKTL